MTWTKETIPDYNSDRVKVKREYDTDYRRGSWESTLSISIYIDGIYVTGDSETTNDDEESSLNSLDIWNQWIKTLA